MKYIVMNDDGNDIYNDEFDNREDAIKRAEYRSRYEDDIIVLESVNPDEDAADHFDGNLIWEEEKDVII